MYYTYGYQADKAGFSLCRSKTNYFMIDLVYPGALWSRSQL